MIKQKQVKKEQNKPDKRKLKRKKSIRGHGKGNLPDVTKTKILLFFCQNYPNSLMADDVYMHIRKTEHIKNNAPIYKHLNKLTDTGLLKKERNIWKINESNEVFQKIVKRMYKFNLITSFLRSKYLIVNYHNMLKNFMNKLGEIIDKHKKLHPEVKTSFALTCQLMTKIRTSPTGFDMFLKLKDKTPEEITKKLSPFKNNILTFECITEFFTHCITMDYVKGYKTPELERCRAIMLRQKQRNNKDLQTYYNILDKENQELLQKEVEEYYNNHPEEAYTDKELRKAYEIKGGEKPQSRKK